MQWSDLLTAFALVLVFEGIPLFLGPAAIRNLGRILETVSDRQLRTIGLISMLAGVALLSVVR